MRKLTLLLIILSILSFVACTKTTKSNSDEVSKTYVSDNYTKKEVLIEMRDGVKLHTTIYSPKDTSKEYPIMMQRTL